MQDAVFTLDLGRRILIIVIFLSAFWFFLNWLVIKIKSGQLRIPEWLLNKFPTLNPNNDPYQISIIQRTVLQDRSELLVLDINGRHVLVSKTLPLGLRYITDLKD